MQSDVRNDSRGNAEFMQPMRSAMRADGDCLSALVYVLYAPLLRLGLGVASRRLATHLSLMIVVSRGRVAALR
jgi:hypothetical protein